MRVLCDDVAEVNTIKKMIFIFVPASNKKLERSQVAVEKIIYEQMRSSLSLIN